MNIIEECDFGPIGSLTELKVLIWREYHREAALSGHEGVRRWLDQEYSGWGDRPWKRIRNKLRQQRAKALEQQGWLEGACHIIPTLEEIRLLSPEACQLAITQEKFFIELPVSVTRQQLDKVAGLTEKKYRDLIRRRGGIAEGLLVLKRDFSAPLEPWLKQVRWFMERIQPIAVVNQEAGKSSTKRQLLVIANALIVYRLLHRGGLSISKAVACMEKHGLRPPYSLNHESQWTRAKELAAALLKQLKNGRFSQAVQKFLMTRQSRKLLTTSKK